MYPLRYKLASLLGDFSEWECTAMAGRQSFLDNLENLSLVMTVALEHAQVTKTNS